MNNGSSLRRHALLGSRSLLLGSYNASPQVSSSRASSSQPQVASGAVTSGGRGRADRCTNSALLPLCPRLRQALEDLVAQRLCSPTQPLPRRSVYDELTNRSRLVEDFHFSKTTRRITRQRLALQFLRRYNVLLHGLLFYAEGTRTWNTTNEFHRLALLGESILTTEVRTRLLKLFPGIPNAVYVELLPHMISGAALAAAFDRYDMASIVGLRPEDNNSTEDSVVLTTMQKCHMLCAVVAEMYWFTARTKPTDLTHNNALFPPSDVLILHVLSTHLLESIPAELIYVVVEPIVEELRRVWVNAPMSLPSQLRLVPRTIRALSLNTVPAPVMSIIDADTRGAPLEKQREALKQRRPLSRQPDCHYIKSHMRPSFNLRNFDLPRYRILKSDPQFVRMPLAQERLSAPPDEGPPFTQNSAGIARVMELARRAQEN